MSTTTSPTSNAVAPAEQPSSQPVPLATLPPMVEADDTPTTPAETQQKHPKGKRKRTVARDKIILEEAYNKNHKPDKQARLEIVNLVGLTEKEVQIWFQNRRQNDRRKSRPLSQQEIAALRFGGMHVMPAANEYSGSPQQGLEKDDAVSDPAAPRSSDPVSSSPQYHIHATPSLPRSRADMIHSTPYSARQESVSQDRPLVTPKSQLTQLMQQTPTSQSAHNRSQSLSNSMPSSVGYLANRWNVGSSYSTPSTQGRRVNDSFGFDMVPPSSCSSEASNATSRSKVRLSLSLEGKAELVSGQNSPSHETPSRPPSTTPCVPARIRDRSLSAASMTLPPIASLTGPLPPRLMRGRSRDVHAWESCADAERRDKLTTQAEDESNGSAIAAISLLRSSSGVLQLSTVKRNAPVSSRIVYGPQSNKRAKFGRTISSVGRLESAIPEKNKPVENGADRIKVSMLVSPSGDSDKENWSPGDGSAYDTHRRRPLPPIDASTQHIRRTLQESKSPAFLANRANTAPVRNSGLTKEGIEIFRDSPSRSAGSPDEEVERFMRGQVSPSKKGDMDCVAGLLSLSQGAWR